MSEIERVEIHNGRVEGNRIIEVRGIPSGRRTVEVVRGRKWAKVRMAGRRTFKRIPREAFERLVVPPNGVQGA